MDFHVNSIYEHWQLIHIFKKSVVQAKQNPSVGVIGSVGWQNDTSGLGLYFPIDMSGNAWKVHPEV